MSPPLRCEKCRRLAVPGRSLCAVHGRSDPKSHADYSGQAWKRLRREMIQPGTLCAWCGRPGTLDDPLELDHRLPWIRGGTDDVSNVAPVHRSANRAKGGRLEVRRCRA